MMRLLLVLPLLAGCAVRASYFLIDAERAWQQAEAAGAVEAAPYHATLAREYLVKAREEAGYSDYQASERFAKQAIAAAEEATRLAEDPGVNFKVDESAVPDQLVRPPETPDDGSPAPDLDLHEDP